MSLLLFDSLAVQVNVEMMHNNLGIEPGHVLIIPNEDILYFCMRCIMFSFSTGNKFSLMKLGLELASSLIFI